MANGQQREQQGDGGPVVVGINRTQDGSICVMQGSRVLCAIQKERLTRQKHHWGRLGDLREVYKGMVTGLDQPVDAIVECFSSDQEIERLADYEQELRDMLTLAPGCRRTRISHHLSHLYSVFHPSPFDEAAVMIVDGQGSPLTDLTEDWADAGKYPGHWREVSSFYRARRARVDPASPGDANPLGGRAGASRPWGHATTIECIGKQLFNGDDHQPVGLGMFYFLLTQAMFPGEGNEGKVMGLAPHGDPDAFGLPPLNVDGCNVTIPREWREILAVRPRFRYDPADRSNFKDIANLAAAGQRAFEEALLKLADWLHGKTGLKHLCFAGGTGLNCSANDRLLRESKFERVFIPPAPSDAGTSLGCAVYGLTELLKQPCDWRWTSDYLGPEPQPEAIEAALKNADDLIVEQPASLIDAMVDLLVQNKVVALYHGRSEFGPRALGHRSIIGNPLHDVTRDWINAQVKEREWFRPLAPIVLLEDADRYFDIRRPSPFMQFAAPVLPEAAKTIPAVTHVDCTARLQTVGTDDDPFVRQLLQAFGERSGVPVLLNTSYNRKEEPIVETPAQALESFRRTPMHALVMPPFLVRKRDEPEDIA